MTHRKYAIIFGFRTGLFIALWNLASFLVAGRIIGMYSSIDLILLLPVITGFFGTIIQVMGLYLGLSRGKRSKENQLTFAAAFRISLLYSLVCAGIAAVVSFFCISAINPMYNLYLVREAERVLTASGRTAPEISRQLSAVRKEFSTPVLVFQVLVVQSGLAVLGSFLCSMMVRTRKQSVLEFM